MHFQRQRADADHFRILFSEHTHDRRRNGKHDDAHHQQEGKRYPAAEKVRLQHPVISLRPEIEPAYRLETLAKTNQRRIDKHHDPRHNRHGRHRRVSEPGCRHIQQNRSHACQPLPSERRQPGGKDLSVYPSLKSKIFRQRLQYIARTDHQHQQNDKAHKLTEDRGDGRA